MLAAVAARSSRAWAGRAATAVATRLTVPPGLSSRTDWRHLSAASNLQKRRDYRAYLLDMDGVLHQFGKPVPGASEFIEHLVQQGIPFTVITNECRYTKAGLQTKLEDILGVTVPEKQIYTAANAVGDFFKRSLDNGWVGNVFAIGEAGLLEGIREALAKNPACQLVTHQDEVDKDLHCDFVCIGTVKTGGPNDTWVSAEKASAFLKRGAKLLYSNPDSFEVTADGSYKFGCPMPVVQLLMEITGCSSYNLGKPNPWMLRRAHQQMVRTVLEPLSATQRSFVHGHIDFGDVLFVGDSINTDVRIAIENGIDVALVMSGTTTPEKLKMSALQPNYVFEDIKALHEALVQGSLARGGSNHQF